MRETKREEDDGKKEGKKKERKKEEKEKEEEGRETVTQRRKIRLEISSGAHCWPFVSRSQGTRNTRISRNNARASSNAVEGTGQRGGEGRGGEKRRTSAADRGVGRSRRETHGWTVGGGKGEGGEVGISREIGEWGKERENISLARCKRAEKCRVVRCGLASGSNSIRKRWTVCVGRHSVSKSSGASSCQNLHGESIVQ